MTRQMQKLLLVLSVSLGLAACSSNQASKDIYKVERLSIVEQLIAQKRWADARVQLNVLSSMYPQDQQINQSLASVESRISKNTAALMKEISAAKKKGDTGNLRIKYLRVLALEPGNKLAYDGLQSLEHSTANSSANLKAQNIKREYTAKKKRSEKSRLTDQYYLQAEELLSRKNLIGLFQLSERFLAKFPDNKRAKSYRYSAYVGLGDAELADGQEEQAIEWYEQALKVSVGSSDALKKKVDDMKRRLSDNFFRLGIKSLKSNIDKAVEYLQSSIQFDPENLRAHQQLVKAMRIQQNLRKINGHSN